MVSHESDNDAEELREREKECAGIDPRVSGTESVDVLAGTRRSNDIERNTVTLLLEASLTRQQPDTLAKLLLYRTVASTVRRVPIKGLCSEALSATTPVEGSNNKNRISLIIIIMIKGVTV